MWWAAAAWRRYPVANQTFVNCKNVFLPVIRGQGLAKKLALMALDHAREQGFKRCYLETTAFYARRLRYTNV